MLSGHSLLRFTVGCPFLCMQEMGSATCGGIAIFEDRFLGVPIVQCECPSVIQPLISSTFGVHCKVPFSLHIRKGYCCICLGNKVEIYFPRFCWLQMFQFKCSVVIHALLSFTSGIHCRVPFSLHACDLLIKWKFSFQKYWHWQATGDKSGVCVNAMQLAIFPENENETKYRDYHEFCSARAVSSKGTDTFHRPCNWFRYDGHYVTSAKHQGQIW